MAMKCRIRGDMFISSLVWWFPGRLRRPILANPLFCDKTVTHVRFLCLRSFRYLSISLSSYVLASSHLLPVGLVYPVIGPAYPVMGLCLMSNVHVYLYIASNTNLKRKKKRNSCCA